MTSSPQFRALGELLGTEALGIDLSRPLDEATFAWIGRVFAEHPVLVFRDQKSWRGRTRRVRPSVRLATHACAGQVSSCRISGSVLAYQCRGRRQGGLVWRATDWHTD